MARTNSRLSRVVKEAVARILTQDISDPRLQLVTITDAEVTRDQSYATIWYSTIPQGVLAADPLRTGGDRPASDEEVAAAFASAHGRIQGLLADRLTSRKTPELRFEADPVTEQAARVEDLIRRVRDRERSGDDVVVGDGVVDPEVDARPDPLDEEWDRTDADDPSA
ncbi:30S ribosome-binding factor RbfA [Salsipaludibacter albus]|uniref:30S ribosome-binding factor RbfA n=1 Tax=Salsipaludibacter albus TaxID=2849650 RepID=UPI001EE3C7FF|nr:30S ribosome-binding factor RbfA [Salsipaludibacter albus]MBY5162834.1 30S ribosome-binding factor RbfA [Salsipaludibacter albus]